MTGVQTCALPISADRTKKTGSRAGDAASRFAISSFSAFQRRSFRRRSPLPPPWRRRRPARICRVESPKGYRTAETRKRIEHKQAGTSLEAMRPSFLLYGVCFFFLGPLGLEVGFRSTPFRKWVFLNLSKKTNNPNPSPIGNRFGLYGFAFY